MKLDATLNFDLLAVEHEETVHALLELTAPTSPDSAERPPATLEAVIDRSGSMAAGRLAAALQALHSLIGRLRPEDRLGLVTFDDEVAVPVAAGPVGDGHRARAALGSIYPGGTTNLSAGYLRGIQEAHRVGDGSGATVVLLSDGHANTGVVEHGRLEEFAAGGCRAAITTSTIGIGLDYDEDLLAAISRGGSGNAHFAEQGDAAGAALASEVDGLLEQAVQAASLTVRPGPEVAAVRLFNDLPVSEIEGGFMAELGDFYGGETRRLVLEIDVPAIERHGIATVCELEVRWVDVASMKSEVATIPVSVNVVPGDEASGRTENPTVATEIAFQRAQSAKREATDALRDGDPETAKRLFREASSVVRKALASAPAEATEELAGEARLLEDLADRAELDSMAVRKLARADYSLKAWKRGRRGR